MKRVILIALSIIIGLNIQAQPQNIEKANSILSERGEVYFSFNIEAADLMSDKLVQLSKFVSFDEVTSSKITAYANKAGFAKFIAYGYDFEILTPPSMLHSSILENSKNSRELNSWDYYPSWDEYNTMMNQFVTSYPDLCELVTLGTSINGREILAIHINNDLSTEQNEPEFFYTSTMHGDEVVGYVLMLRYIDYLLANYGVDSDVTFMVDYIDIWINPLANPDGTYAGGNNSVWGATRSNANNVDINRNFPDPEDGPHPDGNPWQTETIVFMDFAENHNLTMSSNMHGGAEVVNYPWDTWPRLAADDDWWVNVSREYADIAHENSPSGYFTDLNNGITNGYQWYTTSGCRQDYMNYFHNCREMTLEISSNKMPSESYLDNFWEYNYRSFIAYMKQVTYGFSGIVTNAVTGNPIMAEVFINNHDEDNSEVFSHQPLGDYHRPIKAGNYDVTFSAFGYYDQTININVEDYQNLELNVELMPVGTLISDFSSSTTYSSPGSSINFFDHSLGNDIVSWEWTFDGGIPETSTDINPTEIEYSNIGEYDVTLKVTNGQGENNIRVVEDFIHIKEAIIIDNTTVTNCDALFYDSGAESNGYSNDEDYTITFYPDNQDVVVVLDFIEFDVENHFYCENDYLEIYDGSDINSPLLDRWCGTHNPGRVYATNNEGALTVYFHSNSSIIANGWKAIVSCDSNVGISQIRAGDFIIFPNPTNSKLNIDFEGEISSIILLDITGRQVFRSNRANGGLEINVSDIDAGLYLLSFNSEGRRITKKIIIEN